MRELNYRVERPQYLRMTLEDCSLCLKNFSDPFLSAASCCDSLSDEEEIEELMDLQNQKIPDTLETLTSQNCSCQEAVKRLLNSISCNFVSGSGKIQSPKIEQWLSENFMEQQDVSIARSDMYTYYCECCQFHGDDPCNQATFGKVVRVVFPKVKTRRIGVRGQSRYHYFGIGPTKKNGSVIAAKPHRCYIRHDYTDNFHGFPSLQESTDEQRLEGYDDIVPYLTDFPSIKTVEVKMKYRVLANEFLHLYKDHATRIISSVVTAEFQKVKDEIYEFWTNLSTQLYSVINQPDFLVVIEQCDQLVYFVINDILVPKVPAISNKGMTEAVADFLHSIPEWFKVSLTQCSDCLKETKLTVYQQFQQSILKQLQINAIYTVVSTILKDQSVVVKLAKDWSALNKNELVGRVSAIVPHIDRTDIQLYMTRLQVIFSNCENIPDKLTSLVNSVLQDYWKSMDRRKQDIQSLILSWSYVSGQIIQLIADTKSPVSGLFLLLDVLCKDYLLCLIERRIDI